MVASEYTTDEEIYQAEAEQQAELQHERLLHYLSLQEEVEELARKLAEKLNKMIKEGHATEAFSIAIFLAILKDGVLDWGLKLLGIGLIPIVSQIPGWFVSGFLVLFLFGKGWFKRMRPTYFILVLLVGFIPYLDVFPEATIDVLVAWHIVRKRAKKAERDLRSLEEATVEELRSLDEEYDEEESDFEAEMSYPEAA